MFVTEDLWRSQILILKQLYYLEALTMIPLMLLDVIPNAVDEARRMNE